jgi:hypothetical protein
VSIPRPSLSLLPELSQPLSFSQILVFSIQMAFGHSLYIDTKAGKGICHARMVEWKDIKKCLDLNILLG